MTPDRVMALLDAYGADPARWPDAERDAAMAMINADPALAARRDEAAALDGLLMQAETPQPSADLARRILESAAGHGEAISAPAPQHGDRRGYLDWLRQASQQLWQQLWPQGPAWQPALGLAASLAVGIWVGTTGAVPVTGITGTEYETASLATDDASLSIFYDTGSTYEEWAQ